MRLFSLAALALLSAARIDAQQVHVLIVTGLGGDDQHRRLFDSVATMLADSARAKWGVRDSSIVVLGEDADVKRHRGRSTKEEVQQAFLQLSKRMSPGDVFLVFLNGHGAGEGPASRVNLPGPDPTAADFAMWVSPLAKQRVVFVNAASGSGDFVPVLAGAGRVVVSATKTAIERNETIFPALFVRGLTSGEADADKDGRISVYEAFDYAKKEVARRYEAEGKLLTEHAVLSDTAFARSVAFGGARASTDPRVVALVAERQELESQVAALRARKATMDAAAYDKELERLLLLLAGKTQAIRAAGLKP
ncbi:MAG: hypothetical protein ABIY52_07335 [Gemmatimonadaceae bacterium]